MSLWRKVKPRLEAAEHAHFVDVAVSYFWDWRGWAISAVPSVVTFIGTSHYQWDPWAVWVASLVVFACVAIIYIAWTLRRSGSLQQNAARPTHIAEGDQSLETQQRGVIDQRSIDLAGVVHAVMERALQYGFKLPPAGDPWVAQYESLKNSTHPIWTDPETNQLRRDLLQYCAIVSEGREAGYTAAETQDHRAQLRSFGRQLIAKLKGEAAPETFIPLMEAATRAYEQLRHTPISIWAEASGDSGEDALTWYCRFLTSTERSEKLAPIALTGVQPPSRIQESIDVHPSEYDFVVENDTIVLQERNGRCRYEKLSVNENELAAAIEEMKKIEV
jgi:hypothetical protein